MRDDATSKLTGEDAKRVDHATAPETGSETRRWRWTLRLGRLGVVAAVVLGVATGTNLGGGSWETVLLSWLSGLPFSLPLAWSDALSPNAQGGVEAAWSWVHLALGLSTVASWTAIGAVVDQFRARRQNASPPALEEGRRADPYLTAAQEDVEAILRGADRTHSAVPR